MQAQSQHKALLRDILDETGIEIVDGMVHLPPSIEDMPSLDTPNQKTVSNLGKSDIKETKDLAEKDSLYSQDIKNTDASQNTSNTKEKLANSEMATSTNSRVTWIYKTFFSLIILFLGSYLLIRCLHKSGS